MNKQKLFQETKKFDDIFATWKDDTGKPECFVSPREMRPMRDKMVFSTFCPVEFATGETDRRQWNTRYYRVTAKPEIEKLVLERTIHVEYDTMNFKIIDWHDGTSLVACDHSAIIGGVWVCLIDNASIPRIPWTKEE